MGNCLYDKSYASEVVKMKAQPVRPPFCVFADLRLRQTIFNPDALHRRVEFVQPKRHTHVPSDSTMTNTSKDPKLANHVDGLAAPLSHKKSSKDHAQLPPDVAFSSAFNGRSTTNTSMASLSNPTLAPSPSLAQPVSSTCNGELTVDCSSNDDSMCLNSDDEAVLAVYDACRPIKHENVQGSKASEASTSCPGPVGPQNNDTMSRNNPPSRVQTVYLNSMPQQQRIRHASASEQKKHGGRKFLPSEHPEPVPAQCLQPVQSPKDKHSPQSASYANGSSEGSA